MCRCVPEGHDHRLYVLLEVVLMLASSRGGMAMIKVRASVEALISVFVGLTLVGCSTGTGRYSVDSGASGTVWTLVGILVGGYVVYSIIKALFGKKDDGND